MVIREKTKTLKNTISQERNGRIHFILCTKLYIKRKNVIFDQGQRLYEVTREETARTAEIC